jgi:hypothetical protein
VHLQLSIFALEMWALYALFFEPATLMAPLAQRTLCSAESRAPSQDQNDQNAPAASG